VAAVRPREAAEAPPSPAAGNNERQQRRTFRTVRLPQQRPKYRRYYHRDQNGSTNDRCQAERGVSALWIHAGV